MDKNNPSKNSSNSQVRTLQTDIDSLKDSQSGEYNAPEVKTVDTILPIGEIPRGAQPKILSNPFNDSQEDAGIRIQQTEGLPPLRKEGGSQAVRSIHTYTSDVAEAVQNDHTSLATVAIAENDRRNRLGGEESTGSHIVKIFLMIIFGLALLGAGGYALYYFLIAYNPSPTVAINQTPQDIIASDSEISLSLSSMTRASFVSSVNTEMEKPRADGTVEHIALTLSTATTTVAAAPLALLTLLQTQAPDTLILSFEPYFFFGIHETGTTSEPFLILKSNSFSNTLAGMSQWEKTMIPDLQDILLQPQDRLLPPFFDATETGDTYTFQDAVIDNKNVRVALDPQGNIVLIYTFLDDSTLVIATDEPTLKEIESRIVEAQSVR